MGGTYYVKRFNVRSVSRNTEYDVTMGKGSKYCISLQINGEAEVVEYF